MNKFCIFEIHLLLVWQQDGTIGSTEIPGKRDKKLDKNGSKSNKKAGGKSKESSDNGNGDAVQDHQVEGHDGKKYKSRASRVCIVFVTLSIGLKEKMSTRCRATTRMTTIGAKILPMLPCRRERKGCPVLRRT